MVARREWLAAATRITPVTGSRWVAARAALTMLTALSVLWRAGALDHAAYATFGAFASVYGGTARTSTRWRLQAAIGALLTTAVGCGAVIGTFEHRAWLSVPVAAAWAAGAAWLSGRFAWRPPGPMFAVFAVSTCAAIPARASDIGPAVLTAALTAVFAVALGVLETRLLGRTDGPPAAATATPAVRCAIAVALAGSITTASGIGHPYWAMTASVVPLAVIGLHHQVARGLNRVAGTVVGLGVAAVLLMLPLPALVVIVLVAGCQALTELLVVRHYAAALVFITPLALLVGQLADRQPVGELLLSRLLETAIGVCVGVAVAVATRPRDRPPLFPASGSG
ncbi:FUSC family protein [Dactylosporangium sp. CS-047395]|uniref:FUSC family protein n=1 Tax=Dactylosporangium sp. CS-047395 TaxID=3239936 RepID=UPI003D939268